MRKLFTIRTCGVYLVILAAIYLVLVVGFGRPLGLIAIRHDESSATGSITTENRYRGWQQFDLIALVGSTVSEARKTLGTPIEQNTLIDKPNGPSVILAPNIKADLSSIPDDDLVVVGYCVTLEMADRYKLVLGAQPRASIESGQAQLIRAKPRESLARFQQSQRCDPDTTHQVTSAILVKPH